MNPNRRFIKEVLESGVELGCIAPEHILAHVTPEVLAHHLPVALKARLLQASLEAERMTPQLVVNTVGIDALVEHSPLATLWACVRGAVEQQLGEVAALGDSAPADRPPLEPAGLKPAKSARPAPHRGSSRVSSLSPRSRVMRGRDDAAGAPSSDYELVEETDVLRGSSRAILQAGDEETRPGPKS